MIIYPAIDLYEGNAVRLFKGNYAEMTIYSHDPLSIAKDFEAKGATHIHMVDLEGAKNGTTPNFHVVVNVKNNTDLFVEVGGGIRTMEVIDKYIEAGVDRVILGTAAVTDEGFVEAAVLKYKDKIAVGIDIKDGYVAIKGWTEKSQYDAFSFCEKMQSIGVTTLICTDISKDGAMHPIARGAHHTG
ncbi:MAG: 1-(5-phosphoribosyl)-5-((5-phosphoribosylamino)methylideneamino)imidazole-4-carboxamide isomerase, partial [Clostridia bacterium]|nr:1-(5-phosphoribosyl)-5-((5-phosphoribosylamino)methylideneamino)imidazole-4-carboxamide isomerase [Clostridia bacterium]